MNKKCKVTIYRNPIDSFQGEVVGETTTHWLITHRENPVAGELFPKRCLKVSVVLEN